MTSLLYTQYKNSYYVVGYPSCTLYKLQDEYPFLTEMKQNESSPLWYLNTPPTARTDAQIAATENFVLIFGGEGCQMDNGYYLFDLEERVWLRQESQEWWYGGQLFPQSDRIYWFSG